MYSEVLKSIKDNFANAVDGSIISIKGLDKNYPAWVIKNDGYYGVAVKYTGPKVSEKFNNVRLWSNSILIGEEYHNYIMLTSTILSLRNEFASICSEFVYPGDFGEERTDLLSEPYCWWNKWKLLMGNSVINKKTYSVIAEMEIYERLLKTGKDAKWGEFIGATHDIETKQSAYEVKSTINRYDNIISINSQFQLKKNLNNLYLVFCRMEESKFGVSIEDKLNSLIELGVDRNIIETTLEKLGFEEGNSARKVKYKILDIRKYVIDENFPKITLDNFKGTNKELIKKITYSIDLTSLPYDSEI